MLIELYREEDYSHYFFHALIGRSANDALSRIVAWRVKKRIGGNALVTIDDYGFLLTLRPFQEMPLEDGGSALSAKGRRTICAGAARIRTGEVAIPRRRADRLDGAAQLSGTGAQTSNSWSSEVLFRVLEQHEPDHPLLEEAYRQARHTFLDAEEAYAFLDRVQDFDWKLRELPVVSPFSFAIYASKIKESMMLEDPAAAIERIYAEMYARVEQVAAGNSKTK